MKTKMLIQVHDELIFEVPDDEIFVVKKEIPNLMAHSPKVLKARRPIKVDIGEGMNWDEAH